MRKRARLPGRLFQPMLGKLLGILFLLNVGFASAQESTFSTTVGMAVLCLDDVEPGFFFNYLSNVKPAYKREQGLQYLEANSALAKILDVPDMSRKVFDSPEIFEGLRFLKAEV
jgi:hypothetical protein